MSHLSEENLRPPPDRELALIAEYVMHEKVESKIAFSTARYCLMDALGCAILALNYTACTKLLGPIIPGTIVPNGVRIPGTAYVLDPILAAFNIGTMIRWLDYNDTWLAAEWGHPSDNLGAILAITDYLSRKNIAENKPPLRVQEVLEAMIKAYEIQGIFALENSFNQVGLDHVILVKIASSAIVTKLLGGTYTDVVNVLSHAFIDGQSLRTYRHAPNTGSRKSWAAGDAASRAVRLAWLVLQGEQGYPSALTAKKWGFYDAAFAHQHFSFPRPFGSYVIENILFKISFPAEFHAQTAVECALDLHPMIAARLNDIEKIILTTQESAIRIISKTGLLYNTADRDHCLQYMAAIGLIFGTLTADHYEDTIAADPRIDSLRSKMEIQEDPQFTKDYLDPNKRSIANAIQVFFKDGTFTNKIQIDYPIGHPQRRKEAIPLLIDKFKNNLGTQFSDTKVSVLCDLFLHEEKLLHTPVNELINILSK